MPVDFDPTPLMKGEVDGFMAYLTNEAITVEIAGYEVTNLPYADNGVPYVAETYTVTDEYLAENRGPAQGAADAPRSRAGPTSSSSRPTTPSA